MAAEPCKYEVKKEGDSTIIRFNWIGCPYSPSPESDPEAMAKIIDALVQVKDAHRVVIAEAYEYEYDNEQTAMLAEIANVLDILVRKENILAKGKMTIKECNKCYPDRFKFVEDLLINKLRKDPIHAYILLINAINGAQNNIDALKFEKCKQCYTEYINNILQVIRGYLEKTKLIQLIIPKLDQITPGDRLIYEEIFSPNIRPNFTLTRYMSRPPINGELIDQYKILKDVDVEIYKIPGKTEHYYHMVPPEFKLPEDEYMVLGMARKIMVGYKPTSTGFTNQTRNYFERVGEDLIATVANEQNIPIKYERIKDLANILARYTTGLGIIEVFLSDPNLQDLYINAPIGEMPIKLLHGQWSECVTNIIPTKEDAEAMASRFRLESGRPLDEAEPVLDTSTKVPGGRARVAVITKNLSPEGLAFVFRRHRTRPWTYPLFIENKMMTSLAAGLLWFVVDGGRCLLFAGPRSSGKTSVLGSTLVEIMKKYRILTIEDTLELPVKELRDMGFNVLSMKVQSAITKLQSELPADEGIRTALRLGDSCLIVGEVRSKEAKALYEAMRVGALSNIVAGTIHGDTPYGVWDRVVNDLDVPTTSFKATDLLVMSAPIRSADGMHRFRRVFTITEVGKNWTDDPLKENGFTELLKYDAKKDVLLPTKEFINGDSEVLMSIANRVREWAGNWEAVYDNIKLRANVKQAIVDISKSTGNREFLEAQFVGECNNHFHLTTEQVSEELGGLDSKVIYERWTTWLKDRVKGRPQGMELHPNSPWEGEASA
ncbi:MAG: ATPase, T2SS/T4P/T4SS family [Candidatus Undinarchaeales archaeon]|jgi:type IV secretory pathway ATPase VirB11/archaellum biosynthesis ATPase|nr:ATPase, T2SS/T4P/T4SS family [Candidatus Undinarchaeales archaeon]